MKKLDEFYSLRIPAGLKHHIDKLTPEDKKHANREVLKVLAFEVHKKQFDPALYLGDEKE
ncbi:MAG: hypothetical protein SFH39_00915 [Candidatus Magnetobacterium sp. LHC-1]|nr:hypothetical protein [Nitrospirota bacterium]